MLNKICRFVTKYLFLWVILAVVIGYLKPQVFLVLKNYNEWFFTVTMLGIGFVLNYEDFVNVFRNFKLVLLGSISQFLIMPLSAFLVTKIFVYDKTISLGFIVTGAVPGAMASNIISYLANADVAYSVSLTTTSTFLSPILTPFFIYLLGGTLVEIKFFSMMLSIIKMVILPILIGLWIKKFFKHLIDKIIDIFPAISTLFISFICGLVVALNRDYLKFASYMVIFGVFILNILGLSLGYFSGYLYGFDTKRKRTLAIEVGMQNAGLGAVLSLKHFSSATAIPSAFFATWCIITATVLANVWNRTSAYE